MLERATACLKAGARDSLKCAPHTKAQVPRTPSRRRLHSTFWTHGAGDINLDVNLVGLGAGAGAGVGTAVGLPADFLLRHDDIRFLRTAGRRSGKEKGKGAVLSATAASSSTTASGPDAPFLDFLYPPQALAWLQRSNGQPWERWERRNARRLPEGFVQAARGYSSRSRARPAKANNEDGSLVDDRPGAAPADASPTCADNTHSNTTEEAGPGEDIPPDNAASVKAEPALDDAAVEYTPSGSQGPTQEYAHSNDRLPKRAATQMVRELAESVEPAKATDGADEDEGLVHQSTAVSAGELAEEDVPDFGLAANPLEALRSIIGGRRRSRTVENISYAWQLYTSLSEEDKADPQLMHELLLWFARMDAETAQAHSISLYWSIPLESRTLTDYEAILGVFLKRNMYDAAAGMHKEALKNIPNGHQITKQLFKHVVEAGNWQLALAVKQDHDSAFEGDGPAQARQEALFWINVAEIADLTQKAEDLVRKCHWFQRRARRDLDAFTAFSASISEEAFRQYLLAPLDWKPDQVQEQDSTTPRLLTLLDSIHLWSPNASRLFEEFLNRLLELNQTEEQYEQAHSIVSYIYGYYRHMPGVQPSEQLLQRLLTRILKYAVQLNVNELTKCNVPPEVIVEDWQKHHTKLSCWAVKKLMAYYARQGMSEPLNEYYTYLKRHYPLYCDQQDILHALIYVHARRADIEEAQAAFDHVDTVMRSNGQLPDLKCWNVLMHAHARTDDLAGGFDTFGRIVNAAGLLPDHNTVHPLTEMLARRGDVDGIADLLAQYDALTGAPHHTSLVGSRMRALIRSHQVPEAEQTLKNTIKQVRAHEVKGSLTGCFNIMLSAYAQRRDIEAIMRTYRWMRAENVRLDRYTYNPLMLVLTHFRQTPAAYTVMTKVMRKEGFKPTAVHYAIVMTGLVSQDMHERAIWVYEKMLRKNIRSSLAARRIYLKALAMSERKEGKPYDFNNEPIPLAQLINELRNALDDHDRSEIASKDPVFSHDPSGGAEDAREYFVGAIFAHGKHRCFEAVQELFRMFQAEAAKLGKANDMIPMQVLTAMMNAHLHNGEYEEVEAYWKIAKDNADFMAPSIAVPDYLRLEPSNSLTESVAGPEQGSLTGATAVNEVDRAEIGFQANHATSIQGTQTLLPAYPVRMAPRPSPGRRYILTRPLRYQLRALAAQNRIADVLTTFTALVRQGYAFDIITWNRLIEYLCSSSPPLVLLAFTLTERYLIRNFPGWLPRRQAKRGTRKSAAREGLQYMRGRYLSYDTLAPQYRTMVFLASALLKLRRMEATGSARPEGDIGRFMGTIRQVEAAAPSTLDAVNSMPQIEHDKLQHRLLRSDEANEL